MVFKLVPVESGEIRQYKLDMQEAFQRVLKMYSVKQTQSFYLKMTLTNRLMLMVLLPIRLLWTE